MVRVDPGLAGNPDRLRWNAKYGGGFTASFEPHPVAVEALAQPLPPGPLLELASGPSGNALLAAAAGRRVVAVDASDVALGLLADEAGRRRLSGLTRLVHADLSAWRPEPGRYSLVLCTGFWDRDLFPAAADAVMRGGLLGWEAYTEEMLRERPRFPTAWCLMAGEPASLLPLGWQVLHQTDLPGAKRRLLARAVPSQQQRRQSRPGWLLVVPQRQQQARCCCCPAGVNSSDVPTLLSRRQQQARCCCCPAGTSSSEVPTLLLARWLSLGRACGGGGGGAGRPPPPPPPPPPPRPPPRSRGSAHNSVVTAFTSV